jgi:hypothetical protein
MDRLRHPPSMLEALDLAPFTKQWFCPPSFDWCRSEYHWLITLAQFPDCPL